MEQSGASLSPTTRGPSEVRTRSSSRTPSVRRQETEDSQKAGRVWAREEDDPWAPCILTLDGGGIRGYSSLLILKELMHQVWIWENVLEEEERSAREMSESQETDDPSEDAQATGGAQPADTELRGRSSATKDVSNNPDEAEGQHGASSHVALPIVIEPAVDQMQQESLAANVKARKIIVEEELLPCHYFEFMYGTSTGGLIATVLGRLRMTVAEALELYRKVGDDLFGKRRSNVPLMTKYYHEPLERAVRDLVGSRCHEHPNCDGSDLHPWGADDLDDTFKQPEPFNVDMPRVCQSCCLTATHDEQLSEAYLLRTYAHYYSDTSPNWITRYNEGADRLPIWQCARATTAAPFYFEMVKAEVDGVEMSFKDGGIRENNPSGVAMSEFNALYDGKMDTPALLLSVGTGRPDNTQDGFANAWSSPWGRLPFVAKFLEKRAVVKNLLIKYTAGEKQHLQLREHARGEHTWYKRLNVSNGLEHMSLDDWVKGDWQGRSNVPGGATLSRMEEVTAEYLEREFDPTIDSYAPPSTMLRQTAEKLVRQRRAREREGGLRWDTFVGKYLHQAPPRVNGHAG